VAPARRRAAGAPSRISDAAKPTLACRPRGLYRLVRSSRVSRRVSGDRLGREGLGTPSRPEGRYSVAVRLTSGAVTVTMMFDHTSVIGGVQSGWNVAVRSSENSALPFCTGKSPIALNDSLLAA
jgi:hypothetical protein